MRISTRLLSNATTTYMSLGTTFGLGLFTTWYLVGTVGVVGFGLLALASSSTGLTRALEQALRMGLVRELSSAIASGNEEDIRRSLSAAVHLCRRMLAPLGAIVALLATAAGVGLFNTPEDAVGFEWALVALIVGEGLYAAIRVLSAPYLQSLFAAQRVGLDNLLVVIGRITYALSAVLVFGWLLPNAPLVSQFVAYAVSRCTLQVLDVILGIWFAKRLIPGLRLDSAVDRQEYLSVRDTVWQSSQVEILLNLSPQFLAILINLFFGLTYNGIWQIVLQLTGYVRLLAEGLLRGLAPLTTHLQKSGRMGAVIDLMTRSIRYQLAFALPAAVLIGALVKPVLYLWVGERLAGDAHLSTAGIAVAQALTLAAQMTLIMLAVRTLRTAFFGVERVLYGIGSVRSYSWFAKWSLLLTVVLSALLMAWTRDPLSAPLGLLLASLIYSPGIVLAAARKETGLEIWPALQRSLPSPLLANLILAGAILPIGLTLERLSLPMLLGISSASGLFYVLVAIWLIPEPDEKIRLLQLLGAVRQKVAQFWTR